MPLAVEILQQERRISSMHSENRGYSFQFNAEGAAAGGAVQGRDVPARLLVFSEKGHFVLRPSNCHCLVEHDL